MRVSGGVPNSQHKKRHRNQLRAKKRRRKQYTGHTTPNTTRNQNDGPPRNGLVRVPIDAPPPQATMHGHTPNFNLQFGRRVNLAHSGVRPVEPHRGPRNAGFVCRFDSALFRSIPSYSARPGFVCLFYVALWRPTPSYFAPPGVVFRSYSVVARPSPSYSTPQGVHVCRISS